MQDLDFSIHLSSKEPEDLTLSAIIRYPDKVKEVFVKPMYFYSRVNQCILQSMLDIEEIGMVIDVPTLLDYISKKGNIDPGEAYRTITELSNLEFTTSNFIYHQNKIIELYKKREQLNLIMSIQNSILDDDARTTHQKLITKLEFLNGITSNKEDDDGHISKVMAKVFEKMQSDVDETFSRTNFRDLDKMILGFKRQDLVILGARPSMGKTAFAMDIAKSHAKLNKAPTIVFSIEMPDVGLGSRMIASEGNINAMDLKDAQNRLSTKDWEKVMMAMGEISNTKMHMFDDSTVTIEYIRRKSRIIKELYPDEHLLIVIDYLQLIQGDKKHGGNRTQEISEISRELKRIARELDSTVLALSQLSRNLEQRQDKRPMNSDLRESGGIEQDADVIMFLYRDDYYDKESESKNLIEVIVSKNRDGGIGTVNLGFKKEYSKFIDIDWGWNNEY